MYRTHGLMMDTNDFLSQGEAATYLGVSRVTVWRRIRDGELPAYESATSKRVTLVKRSDLDKLREPRRQAKRGPRRSARGTRG